jgi:hypothetical protein
MKQSRTHDCCLHWLPRALFREQEQVIDIFLHHWENALKLKTIPMNRSELLDVGSLGMSVRLTKDKILPVLLLWLRMRPHWFGYASFKPPTTPQASSTPAKRPKALIYDFLKLDTPRLTRGQADALPR